MVGPQVPTGRCGHLSRGFPGSRGLPAGSSMKTKESYMTTFHPKSGDLTRKWYVIDANDVVLGRLATHAADLLRGKGKPIYAPNVDCGDNVIIINADKVHISSNKRDREFRYRHSGYPGGLKTMSLGRSMELHPERVVADAIVGMMRTTGSTASPPRSSASSPAPSTPLRLRSPSPTRSRRWNSDR